MADTKISALPSGAPAQAGDEYVVARSGANYKLTLTNIAASMPPIGATTPNTGSFTSLTNSGNLTFSSTGQRITGDFSNATVANRLYFQNSVTNGATSIGALPNGTSPNSGINLFNNSDPTNAAFAGILVGSTEAQFRSAITGTGTYLPMTFYTGGSERFRIDTAGQLGVAGANYGTSGQVLTSNGASSAPSWQTVASGSGLPPVTVTASTSVSATAGNHYVLTAATTATVTLPASPTISDTIYVTVANGLTTNVVARNTKNIQGLAEDLTLNAPYASVQLRYTDATEGWVFA